MNKARASRIGEQARPANNGSHNSVKSTRRAATSARHSGSSLRREAEHLAESAKEGLSGVQSFAHESLAGAKRTAVRAADSAKGVLSDHLFTSVGVAAGVGLIAGFLLRGRRH
jgi:ElaB/YqjD/DUF883 family membrane-anchored ribosome-binding protein